MVSLYCDHVSVCVVVQPLKCKTTLKSSYLFPINRTIFVRETSFQQVLLSSSGLRT